MHGTAVKPGMKAGVKQYMSAFALNEWDSKLAGGVEWRQKIDSQVNNQSIAQIVPITYIPYRSLTDRKEENIVGKLELTGTIYEFGTHR